MKPPNVLFILADEWRADTLACYGNDFVQAPHLNRFAETACVFDRAYCNQPVCTPSRASIWSGLYPHAHGCVTNNQPLPDEHPTLAEMAPEAYHCAYYGKWHLGDEIKAQRGWSEWVSSEDGPYRPYYRDPELLEQFSDYHHFLLEQGYAPDSRAADGAAVFSRAMAAHLAADYSKATFLADRGAAFIEREKDSTRPWFLTLSILEPHMPFYGPYNNRHEPESIPVGPAFLREPTEDMPRRIRSKAGKFYEKGHDGYTLQTEAQWRRLRANYLGLVTLVDEALGKVFAALEATGQADNTLVIVTSDHGEMMGDHRLLTKNVELEPSLRIPMLIRAPGAPAGRCDELVSLVDVAPTVLDFMGAPLPEHLQGVSRRKALLGEKRERSEEIVAEWHDDGAYRVIVSDDGWKLTVSPDDLTTLYYLPEDPHELNNRSGEAALENIEQDLRERLRAWALRTGDDPAVAEWGASACHSA